MTHREAPDDGLNARGEEPAFLADDGPSDVLPNHFATERFGAARSNTVAFQLDDEEAEALAQFVKRVGWSEWRANAASETEAIMMRSAFDQLQKALAEAGFSPR